VDVRTVQRRFKKERIPHVIEGGKRIYAAKDFKPGIQKLYVESARIISPHDAMVPMMQLKKCSPDDLQTAYQNLPDNLLRNPRVQFYSKVVREALDVPAGCGEKEWKKRIAIANGISVSAVYEAIKRQRIKGLAGHLHTKANKGKLRSWDSRSKNHGIGLWLKKENRHLSLRSIHNALVAKANVEGWSYGCYESFIDIINGVDPLLKAIRDRGRRGLDNALPPILRTYADLAPFEIVCGDQHRSDHWVQYDDSPEVFRPELYAFIDLRTRLPYGWWGGQHYNAYSILLSLRMGHQMFGKCRTIYSDWGKPEVSQHVQSSLEQLNALGISAGEELDLPEDFSDQDPEEVAGHITYKHRRAIVRNAKAKLIERFWSSFETELDDRFKMPGRVKNATASIDEQEMDQDEAKKLARAGKLLKFSEYLETVAQYFIWYATERPHQGVCAEWSWGARPAKVTPIECLGRCYGDGWRADRASSEDINLACLPRETRAIDRGRVRFQTVLADRYEHEELARLKDGEKVTVLFDPIDPRWLLVYRKNHQFVCCAQPLQYSSMKNRDLALSKILEKRRLAKHYFEKYDRYVSLADDLMRYSAIPKAEIKARVLRDIPQIKIVESQPLLTAPSEEQIDREKSKSEALFVESSDEKMQAEIQQREEFERSQDAPVVEVVRPKKRAYFEFEEDRYRYLAQSVKDGVQLENDDLQFMWNFRRRVMQKDAADFLSILEGTQETSQEISRQLVDRAC
jgi:hypothetical protein